MSPPRGSLSLTRLLPWRCRQPARPAGPERSAPRQPASSLCLRMPPEHRASASPGSPSSALCLEQCWGCWRRCPHMITFIPEPSASRCHLGSSHAARGAGPCRWPVWQSLPGAAQQAFPAAQTPEGPMVSQVHCAGSVLSLEGFVSPVLTPNPKRRQGGVPRWGRGRDRTRRWPVRCFGLRRKGPGCPRPGGTGTAGPRACPRSRAIRAAPVSRARAGTRRALRVPRGSGLTDSSFVRRAARCTVI